MTDEDEYFPPPRNIRDLQAAIGAAAGAMLGADVAPCAAARRPGVRGQRRPRRSRLRSIATAPLTLPRGEGRRWWAWTTSCRSGCSPGPARCRSSRCAPTTRAGCSCPASIDPRTGYRAYTVDQLADAAVIVRLRALDVPLAEVREVLDARDPEHHPQGPRPPPGGDGGAPRPDRPDHRRAAVAAGAGDAHTRSTSAPNRRQHTLRVRATVDMTTFEVWIGWAFRTLAAVLALSGAERSGPPGALYGEIVDDEPEEVEAFIPIAEPVALRPPSEVAVGELPERTVAVLVHAGRVRLARRHLSHARRLGGPPRRARRRPHPRVVRGLRRRHRRHRRLAHRGRLADHRHSDHRPHTEEPLMSIAVHSITFDAADPVGPGHVLVQGPRPPGGRGRRGVLRPARAQPRAAAGMMFIKVPEGKTAKNRCTSTCPPPTGRPRSSDSSSSAPPVAPSTTSSGIRWTGHGGRRGQRVLRRRPSSADVSSLPGCCPRPPTRSACSSTCSPRRCGSAGSSPSLGSSRRCVEWRRRPTKAVARAFARVAWPAFAVLVLTGLWNIAEVDVDQHRHAYQVTLMIKITLAILSGVFAAMHAVGSHQAGDGPRRLRSAGCARSARCSSGSCSTNG